MSCTQVLFHHSLASAFLHHHTHLQDPEPTAHTSPATELTVPANHSALAPEQSNRQQSEVNSCYSSHGFHNSTSSFTNSTQSLQHAFSFTELAGSRAQYVSANCVVVTHYAGDAATEVDEHFSRALSRINHQHQVVSSSTSNTSPFPHHPPNSCMTSQDNCRLTSTQDLAANNGWHSSAVTPNMWSCESMCDNNNSHPCSPASSPLDLAGPRSAIPENTFHVPSYPEPWSAQQQLATTTAFHLPATEIEATEVSHRDLFWY